MHQRFWHLGSPQSWPPDRRNAARTRTVSGPMLIGDLNHSTAEPMPSSPKLSEQLEDPASNLGSEWWCRFDRSLNSVYEWIDLVLLWRSIHGRAFRCCRSPLLRDNANPIQPRLR
jgi:hypothetical protein